MKINPSLHHRPTRSIMSNLTLFVCFTQKNDDEDHHWKSCPQAKTNADIKGNCITA